MTTFENSIRSFMESNKLIADFVGAEYRHNKIIIGYHNISRQNSSGETWQDCLYHSSWDWLMPVVEKINSIIYGSPEIRIGKARVEVFYWVDNGEKGENLYASFSSQATGEPVNIKAVYEAVVQFIKWYNENKQKN